MFGEIVLWEDDIVGSFVLFGVPGPAVAGYHAGAVAVLVFVEDALVEFIGRVANLEVVGDVC